MALRADDLPAAFASLPQAWRVVLPDWTPQAVERVIANIKAVSGERDIAPPDPFRALRLVAPMAVKVVIFGQDPYPKPGHADGLAFSAGSGQPRSLRRIFEVLAQDRPGFTPPEQWRLDAWAEQGVLLLNPSLTVEVGRTGSHMDCGWQALTSSIVKYLCNKPQPPTFLLWGKPANEFFDMACPDHSRARVLRTRHPSYDFKQDFMREASHFLATADLIDWWGLGSAPAAQARLI